MLEKMANCKKCDFYMSSNKVKNFGIKGKFYLASILILLVVSFLGLYSLNQMKKIDNNFDELIKHRVGVVSSTKDALIHFEKAALSARGFVLTGQNKFIDNYNEEKKEFEQDMVEVNTLLTTDKGKELYKTIMIKYNIFTKYADTAFEIKQTKTLNDLMFYMGQNPEVNNDVVKAAENLINLAEQLKIEEQDYANKIINNAEKNIMLLLVIILLICILVSFFLTESISKPILSLEKQTNLIASGDLTASHVLIKNKDEIGSLANAYNQMINSLKDIVNRVAEKAEDVASASEQLSASAQ